MVWLPVLVAVLAAGTIIQRRSFLRQTRIPGNEFLVLLFPALFGLALVVSLVRDGVPLAGVAWSPLFLILIACYLVIACIAQWVFHRGLRVEEVGSTGLLALASPLVSVALAAFLFPAERDVRLWLVAGIALLALALSHLRGHHVSSREGERSILASSVLFGIEAVVERSLLEQFSTTELYLVRTGACALIFMLAFGLPRPKAVGVELRGLVGIAVVYTVFLLGLYQSFATFGVTVTSIVGLLANVILYAWSMVVDREPVRGRMALAGLVVLASVVYTMFVQAGWAG